MSYSRWSNSRWYTYWLADTTGRDDSYFVVMGDAGFYAKELRADMDACLQSIENATPEELEELRGYMKRFLEDVDREFPLLK